MAISRFEGCRSSIARPSTRISPSEIDSKPGNGVEQGRLAAAGGADQHEETTLLQFEVDPFEDLDEPKRFLRPEISRKAIDYPLTAPAIRPRTK